MQISWQAQHFVNLESQILWERLGGVKRKKRHGQAKHRGGGSHNHHQTLPNQVHEQPHLAELKRSTPERQTNRLEQVIASKSLFVVRARTHPGWQAGGIRPTDLYCTGHQHGQHRTSITKGKNTPSPEFHGGRRGKNPLDSQSHHRNALRSKVERARCPKPDTRPKRASISLSKMGPGTQT